MNLKEKGMYDAWCAMKYDEIFILKSTVSCIYKNILFPDESVWIQNSLKYINM
jgi:hypothetical protein